MRNSGIGKFDIIKIWFYRGEVRKSKKAIESNDDLYLIHHYLKKGIMPEVILKLTEAERLFFTASYVLELEEENKKWEKLSGLFSP